MIHAILVIGLSIITCGFAAERGDDMELRDPKLTPTSPTVLAEGQTEGPQKLNYVIKFLENGAVATGSVLMAVYATEEGCQSSYYTAPVAITPSCTDLKTAIIWLLQAFNNTCAGLGCNVVNSALQDACPFNATGVVAIYPNSTTYIGFNYASVNMSDIVASQCPGLTATLNQGTIYFTLLCETVGNSLFDVAQQTVSSCTVNNLSPVFWVGLGIAALPVAWNLAGAVKRGISYLWGRSHTKVAPNKSTESA